MGFCLNASFKYLFYIVRMLCKQLHDIHDQMKLETIFFLPAWIIMYCCLTISCYKLCTPGIV